MDRRSADVLYGDPPWYFEAGRALSSNTPECFKSGFVTLVGRPNAGKSTLVNTLMQEKIAIVSPRSQTTRHRIRAVLTRERSQAIITDTPGLHKPHDALGEQLNISALKGLKDADVIAVTIDSAARIGSGDEWVASHVAREKSPSIAVLTKTDLVDHTRLCAQRRAVKDLMAWDDIVEISSLTGYNIEAFVQSVAALLPEGPLWFPPESTSDQSDDVRISETIREKILLDFYDEVPHSIGVVIDERKHIAKKNLEVIYASIYVEHESQKGIIIGSRGTAIKRIGHLARKNIEELLDCRVYLDLSVKVKKNWRKDATQIRRFGYGEGG